jgi:hypothetical protein
LLSIQRNFVLFQPHSLAEGILHQYELLKDGKIVFDKTTGLTWQQSGSDPNITNEEARKYIRDLNQRRFAGYDDWRLPTLEEAMSLMEPKAYRGLHIDRVFDSRQAWIWTADHKSAGMVWCVNFHDGYGDSLLSSITSVRAVRSDQQII